MSLTAADFARLMAPLGPFEAAPRLAVALSGGADSLALVLLADAWARAHGGSVLALTVDHGLRPESAAEAAAVKARMAARGIPHETLVWQGEKPARGIQAAARRARYQLMLDACRERGILHLLLAHHADDQAETVMIRADRGSGLAGLGGMALVAPPPVPGPRWPRLLRPLLTVPKSALEATLAERGEPWIEDPSNRNPAFTRVQVRESLTADAAARLVAAADTARAEAAALDRALLPVLARDVMLHPAGFALLAAPPFADTPDALRRAAWGRVIATIGGLEYPPRGDHLDGLLARMKDKAFRGATLAGCRIEPGPRQWRVERELAAVCDERPFAPGLLWDGRFLLEGAGQDAALTVRRFAGDGDDTGLPAAVRQSLPALWEGGRCLGIAAIAGLDLPQALTFAAVRARFLPPKPLLW